VLHLIIEWQPISTVPFDRDPELAVIDYDAVHALAFPCRRILRSWINAETKEWIDVPTHWRGGLGLSFRLLLARLVVRRRQLGLFLTASIKARRLGAAH
jgi:hypothetical protein